MEKRLPPILNEQDLDFYEKRLSTITSTCDITRKSLFANHLTLCKGKLVSVEICGGGCLQRKSGILLDVGEDYISVRTGNMPISTAIPIVNIHSITFVHNNNPRMIK